MDLDKVTQLVEFLAKNRELRALVCEAFVTHVMHSHDFKTVLNCIRVLDRTDSRYIDFLVDTEFELPDY